MPPPAIGFDLDMTLVDSAAGIISSVQHVCAQFGVSADAEEIRATIGLPLDRVFPRWLPDHPYDVLLAAYREHYAEHGVPLTVALPGADRALAVAREAGAKIIVVTAKHGPIAERVLGVAGLEVDVVVGESFAEQKATVLIEHAASIYVGDHPGDMRAAQVAGATGVAVSSGPSSEVELTRAGAHVVLDDLTQFEPWLFDYLC